MPPRAGPLAVDFLDDVELECPRLTDVGLQFSFLTRFAWCSFPLRAEALKPQERVVSAAVVEDRCNRASGG